MIRLRRLTLGEAVNVSFSDGLVFLFQIDAAEGDVVDLSATSIYVPTDPTMVVFAPDGTAVAANDDVDNAGEDYNSRVTFSAPADGTYTVLVTAWDVPAPGSVRVLAQAGG